MIRRYNEGSFLTKIRIWGARAGKKVISPAITMYFCLKDKGTPAKAKLIIIGALAYFILPADLIADIYPVVGFTDDLTVLLTAFEAIRRNVKPEHIRKAEEQLTHFINR